MKNLAFQLDVVDMKWRPIAMFLPGLMGFAISVKAWIGQCLHAKSQSHYDILTLL